MLYIGRNVYFRLSATYTVTVKNEIARTTTLRNPPYVRKIGA